MNFNYRTFWLPLWAYLHQPVLSSDMVWNPTKFWQCYQLMLLERCWQMGCKEEHPRT
ncbi:hypothetical protein [Roseofilum casamattae]|uniref:Uncharacterized protein n=1 Tax=Roseofilum casamattae BLCC-M143 TaxID=3022442 RepID=A0ABT7BRA2_9CYAN|nr:hypothetical protein [Roseofilum casamattae]MDJ1181720.1 hypothetical protein [Roseofilum casamattae BLCC-M143]